MRFKVGDRIICTCGQCELVPMIIDEVVDGFYYCEKVGEDTPIFADIDEEFLVSEKIFNSPLWKALK